MCVCVCVCVCVCRDSKAEQHQQDGPGQDCSVFPHSSVSCVGPVPSHLHGQLPLRALR